MAIASAIVFVTSAFGQVTEAPVYVCSLANPDAELRPHQVCTRDADEITGFITKWDQKDRGLYYCVSTIRQGETARNKETVSEVWGLHVDIDFKDVELPADKAAAEVDATVAKLRMRPTMVVASGNGRHCYWKFKEALVLSEGADRQAQIERIELALKQISDLVGGDMKVTQVTALMRLPGSHNTKFDKFTEVEILESNELTYELDDLEEWLSETSSVILRKQRPSPNNAPGTNPYLEYAKHFGFKPPLDVEQRLTAMMYMGSGDAAVHVTQVAVSASLLNAGVDIEEVVAMLLAATKVAAGEYGGRWNWGKEERLIRRMCSDWLKKHPISPKPESKPPIRSSEAPKVVHLSEHRQLVERKRHNTNVPLHIVLGEAVVGAIRARGDDILFTPKAAWRYAQGLWSMETDKAWLDVEIQTGAEALEIESTNRLLNETRGWITRQPELWREQVPWDAHRQIPTRSGLVDPKTLLVTAPRPEHYCTWRIECEFEPAAMCPWWVTMVGDFLGDREPEVRARLVEVIQEVLGAGLLDVKPRPLSKALILQGGSNFGKSGILEVLGGLFSEQTISTSIEETDGPHGLMAFTRRLPWVLHEAFNQGRWHFSSIVKAMITGEPVNVNVKNGPILSIRVRSPIFWGTNHPPQFKEATKAIINRIIVIEGRTEFIEGEPIGAAAEALRRGFDKPSTLVLAAEFSGLLNWAIAGLQRASARGHIELTDEIRETGVEIRRDSNLVASFIEDCVVFDRDRRVSMPDLCAAFSVHFMENKGEDRRMPSNEAIGKSLRALGDRRIATSSKELRDKHRRYVAGLALNEHGLALWSRAKDAAVYEGKIASVSTNESDVNGWIPPAWMALECIYRMRLASGKSTPDVEVTPHVTSTPLSPKNPSPQKTDAALSSGEVSSPQVVERDRRPRF